MSDHSRVSSFFSCALSDKEVDDNSRSTAGKSDKTLPAKKYNLSALGKHRFSAATLARLADSNRYAGLVRKANATLGSRDDLNAGLSAGMAAEIRRIIRAYKEGDYAGIGKPVERLLVTYGASPMAVATVLQQLAPGVDLGKELRQRYHDMTRPRQESAMSRYQAQEEFEYRKGLWEEAQVEYSRVLSTIPHCHHGSVIAVANAREALAAVRLEHALDAKEQALALKEKFYNEWLVAEDRHKEVVGATEAAVEGLLPRSFVIHLDAVAAMDDPVASSHAESAAKAATVREKIRLLADTLFYNRESLVGQELKPLPPRKRYLRLGQATADRMYRERQVIKIRSGAAAYH